LQNKKREKVLQNFTSAAHKKFFEREIKSIQQRNLQSQCPDLGATFIYPTDSI
jgi:hypothetical protein